MVSLKDIKLEISYPTNWQYKVFGTDRALLEAEIAQTVFEKEYKISFGNVSSGGKYVSLNIDVMVESQDERDTIFRCLSELKSVLRII